MNPVDARRLGPQLRHLKHNDLVLLADGFLHRESGGLRAEIVISNETDNSSRVSVELGWRTGTVLGCSLLLGLGGSAAGAYGAVVVAGPARFVLAGIALLCLAAVLTVAVSSTLIPYFTRKLLRPAPTDHPSSHPT